MDVSGSVEISRSPSLEEQHKTERTEEKAHENKKYRLEKVRFHALTHSREDSLLRALQAVILGHAPLTTDSSSP